MYKEYNESSEPLLVRRKLSLVTAFIKRTYYAYSFSFSHKQCEIYNIYIFINTIWIKKKGANYRMVGSSNRNARPEVLAALCTAIRSLSVPSFSLYWSYMSSASPMPPYESSRRPGRLATIRLPTLKIKNRQVSKAFRNFRKKGPRKGAKLTGIGLF